MYVMELRERSSRWSASELVDGFTCTHRLALEREVRRGARERPAPSGESAVVARRALDHESTVLDRLRAGGVVVQAIARPFTASEYVAAAEATHAAMVAGAGAIVNATFAGEEFSGVADLIRRVPGRSTFGDYTYEVVDIRLAARSEPAAILQACAYADALAQLTGSPFDETHVHVVVADGTTQTFRVADFAAFYRSIRARTIALLADPPATRPDKIAACARCRWNDTCAASRRAADDVALVANVRRAQVLTLREAGIATVAQLAATPLEARPHDLPAATWEKLHDQASLQHAAALDGVHTYHLLPPDTRSGFALLPDPSPGDVYFDMEGDPFVPGGLEYLFGLSLTAADGSAAFRPVWAHTAAAQLDAVATVLACIEERRAADPRMHVYHYAPYEHAALTRLTGGTPLEARFEALVAAGVFVDLYAVVRGALRVSTPSYSIKALELFYRGHKRTSDVADAMGSVVAYEEYLRTHDEALLEQIRIYNQDDCDSTRDLHHWLIERKAEALERYGPPTAAPSTDPYEAAEDAELDALRATLAGRNDHEVLLGDLLEYHRREHRPKWREFFERLRSEPEALIDDAECLAGLRPAAGVVPQPIARSHAYALDFPPQRHGFAIGDTPFDAVTGKSAGEIVDLVKHADGGGRIVLKRGKTLATTALPEALVPQDIVRNDAVRDAVRRFARAVAAGSADASAQAALLARTPPARRSGAPLDARAATAPGALAALIADLDRSVLIVQGPPGTGKTWTAARAIVALLERGCRVGVSSGTHKAINNLLGEIERVAAARGYPLRGLKRSDGARPETFFGSSGGAIADATDNGAFPPDASVRVIAGTPALFAREAMAGTVDVLVVDEAGQLALADAIAIAAAGDSIVLVGDPQQLPHVTVGAHPPGADVSALEHLLGAAAVVPPDRGVFLPRSYRLHPAIARFVSELMYDGRLEGAPACAIQRVILPGDALDGAGLRTLAVPHRGRTNASPEEAAAVVELIRRLRGARVVDASGEERPFDLARDAIVVAPYNAQVSAIREALVAAELAAVRVGTVDKFQGQEATVVLYSMTASSADDVPRGVDFLVDRNRLNVAISRARALAVLVHAPALTAIVPGTIDQMRLLNGLARFIELAAPLPSR
jgi:uncharacterized protein